jgi:starvation-inducible DNA-binding protein
VNAGSPTRTCADQKLLETAEYATPRDAQFVALIMRGFGVASQRAEPFPPFSVALQTWRALMPKVKSLEFPTAPELDTPTDLATEAVPAVSSALNAVLADVFALYLKTKNFHWHVSGPHFRDYHLLLDEQAEQIFAATDEIAERVRKIGGTTLRSIGQIGRLQRIRDNDAEFVAPLDMLRELMNDNKALAAHMRDAHAVADEHEDVATTSLLETFIDEAERRTWFLFEASRGTA